MAQNPVLVFHFHRVCFSLGTGIGFEVTKELCLRGAHVIVAARDMKKAEQTVALIKKKQPSATLETRYLDLKSFDCVRRFAKTIAKDFDKVDVLINNAGIIFNKFDKTVDSFESHLQVNYLSHFMLSSLLLPLLKNAVNGRIINMSAHAYASGKIDIDDPLNTGQWAPAYHHRDAFAHSKLCILLASKHLAKELKGLVSDHKWIHCHILMNFSFNFHRFRNECYS